MENQLPIRMIATDVDGTLLNSKGRMQERNIKAIRTAQEKGIAVVIASGRFAENAYIMLKEYDLSCPIIAVNGAKIVDENLKTLSSDFMAKESALAVHQILKAAGSDYFIFGRDSLCSASDQRIHHSELSQGDKVRALGYGYTHGREEAEECIRQPVQKFYVCNNVPFAEVRPLLANIPGIQLTQSGINNIEIMPQGIDKAYGVKKMAQLLNIPISQVMTLGDQENDIPMLQAAGYGIAMGNASEKTKAVAKYITATHDDAGFAQAIEKYAF